jgi:Calcineurin-like phosphoesterase
MNGLPHRSPVSLLAALLLALASSTVAEDTCGIDPPARVVAVGDVHGAYDKFLSVLRMAGLVDEEARWSGGQAVLVQTGDLLDRGTDARRVLDLLMRLEKEAKKAGGRVVSLLGNHEVMNMLGDLRYVNPEEYETFRTPRSEQLREQFWRGILEGRRDRAKAAGETLDEDALRQSFEKEAPLGFVERTQAFSARGDYGRWLREKSAVAKVGDIVFLHGGLTPGVAALGCRAINDRVRRDITDDIALTRKDPLATLAAGEDGPLWYRGLAREDEEAFAPTLEQILEAMGARAIVVGHTVTVTGRIQERFGGRVVMIDAGMSGVYGGHLAALEVDSGDRMVAIYPGGREDLGQPARPPVSRPAASGP